MTHLRTWIPSSGAQVHTLRSFYSIEYFPSLYTCISKMDKNIALLLDFITLIRIFRPKSYEIIRDWRRLYNVEL
jgi:hypothetical protein